MTTKARPSARQADQRVRRPVIFLHIPKTAGSSLASALLLKYRRKDTYVIHKNRDEHLEEFKNLPYEERRRIRLLKGHMPYGLHEFLPGSPVYVTMLRNPVDRIVSHYYYVLRRPAHYLHAHVTSRSMSLEDYVASGLSPELDNGQTRILTRTGSSVAVGECTPALLAEALRNLGTDFAVVGLSERFDESLLVMQKVLGWRTPPLYLLRNVAKHRPARQELPDSTLRLIESRNQLDLELYEHARRMLQEQISRYAANRDLDRFVALNRAYQWCAPPFVSLHTRWKGARNGRPARAAP